MQDVSKSNTRNWSVVLNNPTIEETESMATAIGIEIANGGLLYAIIAEEVGEKGTPHLQCYFQFKNARKWTMFKKIWPKCHCEPCYSTPVKNMEYCKKDGKFVEFGNPPQGSGKRTDIDEIKELVKTGASMKEIYEIASGFQAMKMAEIGLRLYAQNTLREINCVWIYGPSGTGKSEMAHHLAPNAYWTLGNMKWWDGYEEQDSIIIDDFRESVYPFRDLLRLLDKYTLRLEIKGGSRMAKFTTVIITCPYPPELVYTNLQGEDIFQLQRRITQKIQTVKRSVLKTQNTEVGSNTNADLTKHYKADYQASPPTMIFEANNNNI